jgi:hypothetical protein
MGAPPAPVATTPRLEDAPTSQAMLTIPLRAWHYGWRPASPLSNNALFERGNKREPTLSKQTPSMRQRNGEASPAA